MEQQKYFIYISRTFSTGTIAQAIYISQSLILEVNLCKTVEEWNEGRKKQNATFHIWPNLWEKKTLLECLQADIVRLSININT